MKSLLLILSLLAIGLLTAQENLSGSIIHDGIERDYLLYIPDSYEVGNPLILNFHGYTSSALAQLVYGDFRSIADTAGFMIACPQGTIDSQGNAHWNVGWGTSTVDDVGFTSALIDSLHAEYSFDLDRVYSTGMSNGGFMSYALACELSEEIAAIASVTGTMNIGAFSTCDPQHPMPVMEIHGTNDATVPYNGAFWIEGSEDVVAYWAAFNNISSPPSISSLPDSDPNDGCTAEHWVYENGDNGAEVELYKIIAGGHTWPGAAFQIGVTNYDMDASTEIWRFFSKYDINGLISPDGIAERSSMGLRIYPNPVSGSLQVESYAGKQAYHITDREGRTILNGTMDQGQQSIDIITLVPGYYLLVTEEYAWPFIAE